VLGRKEEAAFERVETLIGKSTKFIGEIEGEGTIRVEGSVQGKVDSAGDVVVGETGQLLADLTARNLLVAGNVEGNVNVQGKVEITKTGKLMGDVTTHKLVIEEGAVIQGRCNMNDEVLALPVTDLQGSREE